MLKQLIKRTVIFMLIAVVAMTSVISGTTTVNAGTKANLKKVKKYIAKQEDSQISDSINTIDYGIVYDNDFDAFSFVFISYLDETRSDYDVILRMDVPANMKGEGDISIAFKEKDFELSAKGKFKIAKCKTSKAIDFKIIDNSGRDYSSEKDIQDGFRNIFDTGMSLWDKCLFEETGFHLKALGVKKYKIKEVGSTDEWTANSED